MLKTNERVHAGGANVSIADFDSDSEARQSAASGRSEGTRECQRHWRLFLRCRIRGEMTFITTARVVKIAGRIGETGSAR
jgi:hypothetical protein